MGGAGQGETAQLCCAGLPQDAAGLLQGGTGGDDVLRQQDALALNLGTWFQAINADGICTPLLRPGGAPSPAR